MERSAAVWVIAHRGASGYAPENTMAAFRRAAEAGAGFIETDLQLSRDARLVALHDDTLERTTNGQGPAASRTLDELRKFDAGSWFPGAGKVKPGAFVGERIPTVEELLAFGREKDIGLYLELKPIGPSGVEHAVVGALTAAGEIPRTVVLSFDLSSLKKLHSYEPLLMTGYLYSDRSSDAVQRAVSAGARQLLPRADRITVDLLAEARRNDLKVVAWTVNEEDRMKQLLEAGVDGIITDYPDKLVALLKRG